MMGLETGGFGTRPGAVAAWIPGPASLSPGHPWLILVLITHHDSSWY